MIFESLFEAAQRKELELIDGCMCRYRITKEGQLTINEIISTKPGSGSKMLEILKSKGALYILAKCPSDLGANKWYEKKGFKKLLTEKTKSNRIINVWILSNDQQA